MLDRRTMLAATMATAAMPGLSACNTPGRKVVVVGAGIAGLAAARDLTRGGCDVVVVEARERIGGRIHTSRAWPDLPIDLGASWIHGIEGNPLTTLAREAGAATVITSYDSATLHIDPALRALGVRDAGADWAEGLVDKARSRAERGEKDISLQAAVEAVAGSRGLTPAQKAQLDFHLSSSYEQEYSGPADQLSAWWVDGGKEGKGEDALFPRGYGQIIDHLAAGLDIRRGKVVQSVVTREDGVTLTFADGEVLSADDAVITAPLGVLKAGKIAFDPPLGEAKQTAIGRLGMGLLNKHWLRFDRVFWPAEYDWHEFLSARKGEWSEWVSLAKVDDTPVLLVFSAADHAEAIEALDDSETVARIMQTARTMFGEGIPDPVASQHTRWRADPFAKGSYSFYATGSTPDDRKALAQSEHGRLHFAGEAQSVDYPGTVHGALLSGRAVARAILEGEA
ncbi:MAG: FAD-dependent oxidoreductase [Sphingomonadaceae bacterium]|nr:FAD-dependent oxidoreductase [Sphingomonadaceae bacterium]